MLRKYKTIKDLRTTIEFNGKIYQLVTTTLDVSKRQAIKSSNTFRKGGYLVRVIPVSGAYALYIRRK